MKFISPSIYLSLFAGTSQALVAPRATKDVYSNFEDIVLPGIPALTNDAPITIYHQLTYTNFIAIHDQDFEKLLAYPDGNQAAVGFNGSFLTAQYTGSPVASFKANYASFGCFLDTKNAFAPAVQCTVQVTAYRPDGTQYADKAGCAYSGLGPVTKCNFPSTWNQVGKLSFQVVASQTLLLIGISLSSLLNGLTPVGLGEVDYFLDDFDATYTCNAGFFVDPVSGLCV